MTGADIPAQSKAFSYPCLKLTATSIMACCFDMTCGGQDLKYLMKAEGFLLPRRSRSSEPQRESAVATQPALLQTILNRERMSLFPQIE